MKIQCPKCKAAYQIADEKIPEKGASVTCKKCQTRITVKREAKAPEGEAKQMIITCPDCGHVNISKKTCASCGKAFSEEELAELTIEI